MSDKAEVGRLILEAAGITPCIHEWQPIETAPQDKDLELLIFCSDSGEQFVGYQRQLDGRWTYARNARVEFVCRPTHWMPLPPPPQEP